jgi:CHAT domain-containing protein
VDPKDGFRGVLLSKQLLFEVARQESGALLAAVASAPPEWRAQWRERERLRHEYATTAILDMSGSSRPPAAVAADQQRMQSLAHRIEALEAELRRSNPAYAAQAPLQMVTLDDVSAGLHAGEVLLEYVEYRPRDFKSRKWGDAHYGVFILQGGTGKVTAVDLGSAAAIDDAEQLFRSRMRAAISSFGGVEPSINQVRDSETTAAQASSALRALIWDPVEKNLTGVKRVYIAPDGALSLIPFEALAKPDGTGGWHYLVESRELVYLNTGRDLARLTLTARNRAVQDKTAVLVSDPDFDANQVRVATAVAGLVPPSATIVIGRTGQQVPKAQPTATLGNTSSSQAECQLPAVWAQGPVDYLDQLLTEPARKQLSEFGWTVTMLTHDSAVEEAVLDLQAPRILQFATHGYYLNCSAKEESWDNPLLRSGMVMTGVNTWPKEHTAYYHVGKEILTEVQARARGLTDQELQASRVEAADGILTAYEVSGMNLQGTELVNLTACETGLGEVTPDGVAGLRQAFLLAGARALTMSMWEVPATETGEELNNFYEKWLIGREKEQRRGTRFDAFHSAQLAALKAARAQYGSGHPYYWAGVVFVGDPGDLPSNPLVGPRQAASHAAE